jgi:4-methyl-5(b-hydroxyethyl)-thiazole monophosphate biosynthesis
VPDALAILYPGCIAYEIMLAIELLGRRGRVRIATPDGLPHRCESGMTIAADSDFATADPSAAAILIPGGDPASVIENVALVQLLTAAAHRGGFLAAICAGPILVAKAGLLRGRRFTHGYGTQNAEFLAPYWNGATYQDAACVVDGKIVTAQAWAHIEFAVTVAELCNALPADRSAQDLRRYYQGMPRR